MTTDWINTAILSASFLALFGLAELLYHFAHVKVELTRKLVHLGTGALTLLFPVMLSNHWFVLLLCGSFALILIVSLRFKLLPSINAIDRVSVGSLAYPVSVYGCYLVFQAEHQHFGFFYIPILTLAICDPIAALAGKRWPLGEIHHRKRHQNTHGIGDVFAERIPGLLRNGFYPESTHRTSSHYFPWTHCGYHRLYCRSCKW